MQTSGYHWGKKKTAEFTGSQSGSMFEKLKLFLQFPLSWRWGRKGGGQSSLGNVSNSVLLSGDCTVLMDLVPGLGSVLTPGWPGLREALSFGAVSPPPVTHTVSGRRKQSSQYYELEGQRRFAYIPCPSLTVIVKLHAPHRWLPWDLNHRQARCWELSCGLPGAAPGESQEVQTVHIWMTLFFPVPAGWRPW